ncbi:hypothetical protein, partial [Halostella sp. PRR32]|uniref:hypothetical protein n=1 Tax=Halostella sp. PRR32 TaxID=3098147 RepID=UPI002B1DF163
PAVAFPAWTGSFGPGAPAADAFPVGVDAFPDGSDAFSLGGEPLSGGTDSFCGAGDETFPGGDEPFPGGSASLVPFAIGAVAAAGPSLGGGSG